MKKLAWYAVCGLLIGLVLGFCALMTISGVNGF